MPAKKTTSTALANKPNTNVVAIQEQIAAQLAALAERTTPASGSAIRVTQDKKYKFPDGTEGTEFSGVILDFVTTRKYYPGAYDPNNITPPACFAISPMPKGMVPSENSPEKQADACDVCPQNQWGSAGAGKACKEGRKLAILPPKDEGDKVDEQPIWTLETSPTSLKAFDAYINGVAKTFRTIPIGVITDFTFDPSVTYASVRAGNPSPNPDIAEHFARQPEATDILKVEPDVSSYGQEPPAPAARGRAPATKRAPARR